MRAWLLLVVALVVAGCGNPAPVVRWTESDIAGELHDAADCGGTWYAVGAVLGPDDATRPAAWTSTDGRIWQSLTFTALKSSFYGPQDVITSVGCGPAGVAMVGSKPGGAHGIPRVSTWRQLPDGSMAEVAAPFETYGGDSAVNVGHLVGGPQGFIITGNRTSGGAVWLSRDGRGFQLTELGGGVARDAVPAPDGSWVVTGGTSAKKSLNQAPAIWLGPGWQHPVVPGKGGYNELQRAVRLGPDIVAVGPRGSAFGAWIGHGSSWSAAGAFGTESGTVASLTTAGTSLFALVTYGGSRGVWRSDDRAATWQKVTTPVARATAVAGRTGSLLLVVGGRLWTAVVVPHP
jgi:hypothetical protein